MKDALLEAIDHYVPAEDVRGVYFKGSASKPWYAPCDYVPELSDLDLHLWLHDAASARHEPQFKDSRFGLAFAETAEQGFYARVPQPLHLPRPQVLVLNQAMSRGWTRSHALVLRGEPYPGDPSTAAEDREMLLKMSAQVTELGLDWLDKLGPQLWDVLRALNWRLSPLPARCLSSVGAGERVWYEPRSRLLTELQQAKFGTLAAQLETYYAEAWVAFAAGWRDPRPMRAAIRVGLDALALAGQVLTIPKT